MKETHREEIWREIKPDTRYLVYPGPDLEGIVHAVAEQSVGHGVLILYPEDIPREDDWRHLSTLPDSLAAIPLGIIRRRRLSEWAMLWPHLFRPVKSVYAGEAKPAWFMKITDLLAGNDFQKKSARVKLDDIPGFGRIPEKYSEAWLFQEMMVNVTRLRMELLKVVHKRGGTVINFAGGTMKDNQFRLEDHISGGRINAGCRGLYPVRKQMLRICISDRLPWNEFSMHLVSGKNRLTLFDHNGRLGILSAGKQASACNGLFNKEWPGAGITPEIRTISDEAGILVKRVPPAIKSLGSGSPAGSEEVRPVEDLMESAFDLAKQTGIGFRDFMAIYYRYGNPTEQITENAYAMMAMSRNSARIWHDAIREYEMKYEWRLPFEDKNICKT